MKAFFDKYKYYVVGAAVLFVVVSIVANYESML